MENNDWITGDINIMLDGEPLTMQLTVPAKPVKAQRMLPIFQAMTSSFVEIGENAVEKSGEKVSCQKGCGACCRQAVPLAEVETYQIAELVEEMPEPRRSQIKERFEKGWQHFAEIGWLGRLDNCINLSNEERVKVILEYFYENIPCPFLEDESCSIHLTRPLACREYLVTSPAENCSEPSAKNIKMVELPMKVSEVVRKISNSPNLNQSVNFVPLILALEWAKRSPDKFPEKPGDQWMGDFFSNLNKDEMPAEG